MRINLTLAGGGNSSSGLSSAAGSIGTSLFNRVGARGRAAAPPPPPAAAPVAPVRTAAKTKARAAERTGAENVRNVGGSRGQEIASAMRALKGLTGQ